MHKNIIIYNINDNYFLINKMYQRFQSLNLFEIFYKNTENRKAFIIDNKPIL